MAEFELNRLKSAGFESASLYNTFAYASYVQKHFKRAIEFYEKTLEIDRNNATALNSMGYILADTGLDPAKGLRLCRKAVDINPQNAAYLDSLGWAHYKCGDIEDARNWLRRAAELTPGQKEIREHYKTVNRGT
jgi:tetratricopeptide (TPR) repeat protein